jgi:hypothetical protein
VIFCTAREPRREGGRIAFTLVDDADFAHRVLFEGTVSGGGGQSGRRPDCKAKVERRKAKVR